MKKLMKYGAIALVAVVAIPAVIGAVAFADDSAGESVTAEETQAGNGLMHRALGCLNTEIAEILGVDEDMLADAFRQAWQDIRDDIGGLDEGERPRDLVIASVAASIGVTEAQLADAIEQAMQDLQAKVRERIQVRQEERLQQAVEDGTITEDEANQIREWWQSRPAALDKLRPEGRPMERMRGNGRFGNGGLWQNGQGSEDSAEDMAPTMF